MPVHRHWIELEHEAKILDGRVHVFSRENLYAFSNLSDLMWYVHSQEKAIGMPHLPDELANRV